MSSLTLQSTLKLNSGHPIPLLGFGVYQNRTECLPACLSALKAGYRHIDSAQVYKNEAEVGLAVRESGLKREEVFVTSKCTSKTHGYEETLRGVEESLDRFGFDYLDLFLIHDPLSGTKKRLDTYRALVEKQKEGKLNSIGVSNFGVKHLQELAAANLGPPPAVNQIEMHPWFQMHDVVTYCRKHGIAIQAYCPLSRGEYFEDEVLLRVCQEVGRSPAQVLCRWSLQKGFIPLPKSVTPSRIISNTHLYDFSLSPAQMEALDELDKGLEGSVSWGGAVMQWKEKA